MKIVEVYGEQEELCEEQLKYGAQLGHGTNFEINFGPNGIEIIYEELEIEAKWPQRLRRPDGEA